jgi:hypothetical protein
LPILLKRKYYTFILLSLLFLPLHSQTGSPERFVQVSGIITDISNKPVSGVAVISKKLHRGALSERTGIYSITSIPGDTIFFRALGFKRYHTIIPPSYEERHCTVDIKLELDTIPIAEVTILPWKSYSEFIRDMTKEKPADPLIENMNDNLASIYVAVGSQTGVSITPEAGYRYAMEQNFNAMATRYQFPVNNLLNPFAWAKFINGVKNGLLKNKSVEKPQPAKPIKKKKKAGTK